MRLKRTFQNAETGRTKVKALLSLVKGGGKDKVDMRVNLGNFFYLGSVYLSFP